MGDNGNGHEELFKGFAEAIQAHLDLRQTVDEGKVREIATEVVDAARLPRPLDIRVYDVPTATLTERVHQSFHDLMKYIGEGHRNLAMVGPAGSGKTTLAKDVAKALNLAFGFISLSAGVTETHLFGRLLPKEDGTFGYVESPFVRIYRNGGVFLFDEVDAADANVLVSVNAALANGCLCNPVTGEIVQRHTDCYILTAGNTWGRGGDFLYVGRNALDAATLDRFVLVVAVIDYDLDLEHDIAQGLIGVDQREELTAWIKTLREQIASNKLRRIASTRLVKNGAMAMRCGATLKDVKRRYFTGWSRDELVKVGEGD